MPMTSLPTSQIFAPPSTIPSSTSSTTPATSSSKRDPIIKKSDLYGECANPSDSSQLDEKKVQDAMKKLSKQKKEENSEESGNKKRGYNSMTTADVTPEEMEAYRRIKVQREDPMAKYLNSDELLE